MDDDLPPSYEDSFAYPTFQIGGSPTTRWIGEPGQRKVQRHAVATPRHSTNTLPPSVANSSPRTPRDHRRQALSTIAARESAQRPSAARANHQQPPASRNPSTQRHEAGCRQVLLRKAFLSLTTKLFFCAAAVAIVLRPDWGVDWDMSKQVMFNWIAFGLPASWFLTSVVPAMVLRKSLRGSQAAVFVYIFCVLTESACLILIGIWTKKSLEVIIAILAAAVSLLFLCAITLRTTANHKADVGGGLLCLLGSNLLIAIPVLTLMPIFLSSSLEIPAGIVGSMAVYCLLVTLDAYWTVYVVDVMETSCFFVCVAVHADAWFPPLLLFRICNRYACRREYCWRPSS